MSEELVTAPYTLPAELLERIDELHRQAILDEEAERARWEAIYYDEDDEDEDDDWDEDDFDEDEDDWDEYEDEDDEDCFDDDDDSC